MNRTTTLQASLVVSLEGSEDPSGMLDQTLSIIKRLSLPCTIGFPSAWLPRKGLGVDHPFPQISEELEVLLWTLVDQGLINYIPRGFSGVPETFIPDNLLEKERLWSHKPPHRSTKENYLRFSPLYFPLVPDTNRGLENLEQKLAIQWYFQGWYKREGLWLTQWKHHQAESKLIPWIDNSNNPVNLQTLVKKHQQVFGATSIPLIHTLIYHQRDLFDFEKGLKKFSPQTHVDKKTRTTWSWLHVKEALEKSPEIRLNKPRETFALPISLRMSPCMGFHRLPNKTSSIQDQLSQYAQGCALDDIPHTIPTPNPDRELIASMLGSATLVGDSMEAQFENGLLVQLRGTFGGTRGMGMRVPSMELEHRKIYWNVESAFSFETNESRGLRQVSVLSNELFTLSGRMVSDYIFFDNFPALVVDVRIQHPWIDKSYRMDQYIPWPIEIWRHPKTTPILFQGCQPNQSSMKKTGTQQVSQKIQDYSDGSETPKKHRLFSKRQIEHQRAFMPAIAWDMPCAQGILRIRRADTLLDASRTIPGQIITSAQEDYFSVTLCPTFSYSNVDTDILKGVQEHFSVLLYDPDHEDQILASKKNPLFNTIFNPWIIRS